MGRVGRRIGQVGAAAALAALRVVVAVLVVVDHAAGVVPDVLRSGGQRGLINRIRTGGGLQVNGWVAHLLGTPHEVAVTDEACAADIHVVGGAGGDVERVADLAPGAGFAAGRAVCRQCRTLPP